jgi:hypothetical protein
MLTAAAPRLADATAVSIRPNGFRPPGTSGA